MTLAEVIAANMLLRGICKWCHRAREIEPAAIKVSGEMKLAELQSRLRCQVCDGLSIELDAVRRPALIEELREHPAVKAVVGAFPGATVVTRE